MLHPLKFCVSGCYRQNRAKEKVCTLGPRPSCSHPYASVPPPAKHIHRLPPRLPPSLPAASVAECFFVSLEISLRGLNQYLSDTSLQARTHGTRCLICSAWPEARRTPRDRCHNRLRGEVGAEQSRAKGESQLGTLSWWWWWWVPMEEKH